ncbi:dimethylamine monooxygenase subunit DmmA family protein [Nocardioides ferulae]|uniref:dimethylamine monooxygenase subunit DmmA family protein n=1 Tax=Nocardioides ferulae TaxID=2340821 RepID=UPI00197E586C|nr:dimethylamine monooxygenase subunit DmmA family protein [Nocardioides ferulae]
MTTDDAPAAETALAAALERARVGVRVALAGPAGACLRLRAVALGAGAEDDEIHVHATEAGTAEVFCAHCSTATATAVGVDGVVPCTGCGRDLVVYHHVSRRLGQYLGFQVDAETLPAGDVLVGLRETQ